MLSHSSVILSPSSALDGNLEATSLINSEDKIISTEENKTTNPTFSAILPSANNSNVTPLVIHADGTIALADANKPLNKIKKITRPVIKIALAGTGALVVFLYYTPASECALSDTCGKWLTDLLEHVSDNPSLPIAIFYSGGVEFAAINAIFSARSIEQFSQFWSKQKTAVMKATKTTLILIYTASQGLNLVFAANNSPPLAIALTLTGALPGALYGATGLIQEEIPYLLNKIKQYMRPVVDLFSPLDEIEKLHRARLKFYAKQQNAFNERLKTQWKMLFQNKKNINFDSQQTPLDLLFNQPPGQATSWLNWSVHQIAVGLGLGLAANQTAPLIKNSINILVKYLGSNPLATLLALGLGSSTIYGNVKITVKGVTDIIDNAFNILSGKPIDSSAFHVRPKTTALMTAFSVLLSICSYALIDELYEKSFPGEDVGARQIFRYGAIAAIDIYHFVGPLELYKMLLSALTRDEKEKLIFAVEKEMLKFKKMSVEEFMEFANQHFAERNRYGIHYFTENENQNDQQEEAQNLLKEEQQTLPTLTINQTAKQPSRWQSWCACFSNTTTAPKKTEPAQYQKEFIRPRIGQF